MNVIEIIKHFTPADWVAVLGAIITVVPLSAVLYVIWVRPSVILRNFDGNDAIRAARYFVPNDVQVLGIDQSKVKQPGSKTSVKNPLAILFGYILHENKNQKCYFLIAPTGIGKTTFLLNMYRYYRKKSRFSFKSPLLLGHIHMSPTQDEINSLTARTGDKLADRLKFWHRKPAKMILLLDGLDEYSDHTCTTPEEFWMDLNKAWEKYRKKFKSFGKVIIAVREQFLQQGSYSSNKIGLQSNSIDNQPMWYLKLKPFNNDQVKEYIGKRYGQSPNKKEVEKTVADLRRYNIKENDVPLISIPLVLSYIEDLTRDALQKAARERTREGAEVIIDRYDVYSVIIEKWLEREMQGSDIESSKRTAYLSPEQLKLSVKFCEALAFKIAATGSGAGSYEIDEDSFIAAEKTFFSGHKSFISHFGDRSLLQKSGRNIRFAHASFMEYFLAAYALRPDEEDEINNFKKGDTNRFSDIDKSLANPAYSFAREMLIDWGWQATKTSGLQPAPHAKLDLDFLHWGYDVPDNYSNIPPSETLISWLKYIENISRYTAIQQQLKDNLEKELGRSDSKWRKELASLNEMIICNQNFTKDGTVIKGVQRLIQYVKSFVACVRLENIAFEGHELSCFQGASGIVYLRLESLNLEGKYLQFFSRSASEIKYLHLAHNRCTDEDLSVFNGASVRRLFLGDKLTGKFMSYFDTRYMQEWKFIHYPGITIDPVLFERLHTFKKWTCFITFGSDINEVYEYLRGSEDTIDHLGLSRANMTDAWMEIFTRFTNLSVLYLGGNEQLTGINFYALESSKNTLLEAVLDGCTRLHPDCLSVFLNFDRLDYVNIQGCPPQNPEIIKALEKKGVTVISG